MIINGRGKLNWILQYARNSPSYSPIIYFTINWTRKAKITPRVIYDPLKAPKVPDVSIGKIYFTINGVIALNDPEQSPWINLQINSNTKWGIKINKFTTKDAASIIKRQFLHKNKITFEKTI